MTFDFAETSVPDASPEDVARDAIFDANPNPPRDESPDRCRKCGLGLPYGGRGRRPVECKRGEGCHEGTSVGAATTRRRSNGRGWQEPLRQALSGNLASVGLVVSALNQADGVAILNGSPRLADALITVAENNDQVRKALENMVTAGAWSGVAVAIAGIAIPIMANHGYLPPGFGVASPTPNPTPQPTPGGGW